MGAAVLDQNIYKLSTYGPVAPSTVAAPVRTGLGRFGDGLFIDEATTNLVTNPSFETNTTGWAAQGSFTIVQSSVRGYAGTKSLRVVATSTTDGGTVFSLAVTNGTTYTVQAMVWIETLKSGSVVQLLNTLGVGLTSVTGFNVSTSTTGRWVRLVGSYTATSTGTVNFYVHSSGGVAVGDAWTVDAVQVEAKAYPTSYCDGSLGSGYAWTGTAHASTSTRAAGAVAWSTTASPGGVTLAAWCRVGSNGSTPKATALAALTGASNRLMLRIGIGTTSGASAYNGTSVAQPTPASTSATAGDLVFVAATWDGTTVTSYVALNGSVVSSATAALTPAASGFTTLTGPGYSDGIVSSLNATADQILVYNRVLTSAEVTALASATTETSYSSDPGILLAAATGSVRGTTNAETAAGTGYYRADTSTKGYVETITATSSNPDDDTARLKVTVAASSGFGQGDSLAIGYPNSAYAYTVQRAFTPGGVYDEVYVA